MQLQANTVAGSSALALVVINSAADGEDLFRVSATLGGSSGDGEEPKGPEHMPTVSDANLQVFDKILAHKCPAKTTSRRRGTLRC